MFIMRKKIYDVLREFMNMSNYSPDEVFAKFSEDKGGVIHYLNGHKFYYKPGTRADKILIVAHADTVWDLRYNEQLLQLGEANTLPNKNSYLIENLRGFCSNNSTIGIGADDRSGAAIAWILKDSGNSILITDEEEDGSLTAISIISDKNWAEIINAHCFILQLDLSGSKAFKCYGAGSEAFKKMIEKETGYKMRPNYSFSDVAFLGKKICGTNLSVGYFNAHTGAEVLSKNLWFGALKTAYKLSKQPHEKYLVEKDFGQKYSLTQRPVAYRPMQQNGDSPISTTMARPLPGDGTSQANKTGGDEKNAFSKNGSDEGRLN